MINIDPHQTHADVSTLLRTQNGKRINISCYGGKEPHKNSFRSAHCGLAAPALVMQHFGMPVVGPLGMSERTLSASEGGA